MFFGLQLFGNMSWQHVNSTNCVVVSMEAMSGG